MSFNKQEAARRNGVHKVLTCFEIADAFGIDFSEPDESRLVRVEHRLPMFDAGQAGQRIRRKESPLFIAGFPMILLLPTATTELVSEENSAYLVVPNCQSANTEPKSL